MKISSCARLIAMASLLAASFAGQAAAHDYPDHPIKLLVPFTPGGGTDILARIVAAKMSQDMGQQIVVENKPGGNTLVATGSAVHAAPDGYTLIMQTNNLSANPTLYHGRLTFDTLKDLAPIALVAGSPHVLVVNPAVPAKTLAEFIALAKAKPGSITFASAGSGTVNHLSGELLKMLAGIDMLHIPYKGSGSLMPDLLAGQVNALFAALPTVMGYIEQGDLRALAVTTPRRFRKLPDVPTIAESGYPGYDFSSWFGMLAPAGTPQPIIARLHDEIVKALDDADVRQRLDNYEFFGSTPEAFADFLKADIQKTSEIIRTSGAAID
jgi:tripartite-type tricarboxylate transporter receptor subunit TctC